MVVRSLCYPHQKVVLIKPIFKKIKGTSSCQVVVLLEAEGKFRTGGQNLGLPSLSFLRDRRPKKKSLRQHLCWFFWIFQKMIFLHFFAFKYSAYFILVVPLGNFGQNCFVKIQRTQTVSSQALVEYIYIQKEKRISNENFGEAETAGKNSKGIFDSVPMIIWKKSYLCERSLYWINSQYVPISSEHMCHQIAINCSIYTNRTKRVKEMWMKKLKINSF